MHPLLSSIAAVALAETGDRTQLLAFVLATRFRRPAPVVAGIVLATVVNHALAGAVGAQVGAWLGPTLLRWIVGGGFCAMAGWTLIPDEAGDTAITQRGAFLATLGAFFMAEMGDKTQLATVALAAAHPGHGALVVTGTTIGMLLANVPVVLLADRFAGKFDLSKVRYAAAALFALFGAWVLWRGVG
jgi:putative Ca2+/H+ antiporter (TMEM165/GDT1 family)